MGLIEQRIPYTMPGELIVPTAAGGPTLGVEFPLASFLHNIELPFEIHSIVVRGTQLDSNSAVIAPPAPGIDKFMRVGIIDVSENQDLTDGLTGLMSTLVDLNTRVWFWEEPYLIERAQGFQPVTIDSLIPAPNFLRAEITFRGYVIDEVDEEEQYIKYLASLSKRRKYRHLPGTPGGAL